MTGRERVKRMFLRQDQDRIPRCETFWPETLARWENEGAPKGGAETILKLLGNDYQGLCWNWPAPFPDRLEVLSQDEQTRTVTDAWGATAKFWKGRSGTPEHVAFECDSRDTWERRFKPALLATGVQINVDESNKAYARGRRAGMWCYLAGVESFEAIRKLIGDVVGLEAMALEPDWIADISRTHTDVLLRNFDAALAAGIEPDGVWIYGDMAYNHATMCSPQMYRDLIWPDHRRLADWAHSHGMKFIFHTDGDVNAVVPLYIAAGFDCLQPLEAKAHMDVGVLCPRYGKRMAFFGNINVMVMASNDLELIEREIASKFAAGKATRGYAYHSDHSVPPSVSWTTYQGIIDLVKRHGDYDGHE